MLNTLWCNACTAFVAYPRMSNQWTWSLLVHTVTGQLSRQMTSPCWEQEDRRLFCWGTPDDTRNRQTVHESPGYSKVVFLLFLHRLVDLMERKGRQEIYSTDQFKSNTSANSKRKIFFLGSLLAHFMSAFRIFRCSLVSFLVCSVSLVECLLSEVILHTHEADVTLIFPLVGPAPYKSQTRYYEIDMDDLVVVERSIQT
jgi:hypothetical protein